jgi:microcystin degradation protein MlrC
MATLENNLNMQYLPEQYRLDYENLKNKVKAGTLDYDTALAQLNQIKASTAAATALANQRNNPTSGGNNLNLDDYKSRLNSYLNEKVASGYDYDPLTGGRTAMYPPKYSKDEILQIIYSFGLPYEQSAQLIRYAGITL